MEAAIDRAQNRACTARIPRSDMRPTAVFLIIDEQGDSLSPAARNAARALTTAIARRVRANLGATGDSLPFAEPAVGWEGASGTIRVTAYRDGRIDRQEPEGDSALAAGARAVTSGLASVIASREMPRWPQDLPDDSIAFTLRLHTPMISRSGRTWNNPLQWMEPAFHVMQPWAEPVIDRGNDFPRYPAAPRRDRITGRFEFAYVVDTSGRIDMRTVTLKTQPRLVGKHAETYRRDFMDALLGFLQRVRYDPARIGGCPVHQRLEQAYEFRLER